MTYDFKKEEVTKEYIANLGIEYRIQCYQQHDPEGCWRLGEYLEAVKKDFKKAVQVFKVNCDDSNHGRSCYKFANYSYLGRGCTKDPDRALSYYQKGCEYNCPESCCQAGHLLYAANQKYKDNNNGLKYFEKGCNLKDSESCYFASSAYITGEDTIEQNMIKSLECSEKASALNNIYVWANLSSMYLRGCEEERR